MGADGAVEPDLLGKELLLCFPSPVTRREPARQALRTRLRRSGGALRSRQMTAPQRPCPERRKQSRARWQTLGAPADTLCLALCPPFAHAQYTNIVLSAIHPDGRSTGYSINNPGEVVGWSGATSRRRAFCTQPYVDIPPHRRPALARLRAGMGGGPSLADPVPSEHAMRLLCIQVSRGMPPGLRHVVRCLPRAAFVRVGGLTAGVQRFEVVPILGIMEAVEHGIAYL